MKLSDSHTYRHKWISAYTFYISWPIWVWLGTGNIHTMLLTISNVYENWCSESRSYLMVLKFCLRFIHFSSNFEKIGYRTCPHEFITCQFCESQCSESHTFTQGHEWISIHTFYTYCTFWVKFSMRDLHTMLLATVSFMKIGTGNAILLLSAYTKLHLCMYNEALWQLKTNKCLGKVWLVLKQRHV